MNGEPQNSASGAITVRRLRNGDQIGTRMVRDKILLQFYNIESGVVTPSWRGDNDDSPTLTPVAWSMRTGRMLNFTAGTWKYNGVELRWGAPDSQGWSTVLENSSHPNQPLAEAGRPKFKCRLGADSLGHVSYTLKITWDLASDSNRDNDLLEFVGSLELNGTAHTGISMTETVIIYSGGPGTYYGYITQDRMLTQGFRGPINLTAHMFNADVEMAMEPANPESPSAGYRVRWYLNGSQLGYGMQTIPLTQSQVNGLAIVTCKFWADHKGTLTDAQMNTTDPDCTALINVTDLGDEFAIDAQADNSAYASGETPETGACTVTFTLVHNTGLGTYIPVTTVPDGMKWETKMLRGDNGDEIPDRGHVPTNSTYATETLMVKGSDCDDYDVIAFGTAYWN